MSTDKKPAKRLYTFAAAMGLALGTMGIAAAANPPAQPVPAVSQIQTEASTVAPDQATVLDAEASEVEGVGDEAVDGIDHQFEGEEVGNNGDGIPDADNANEAAEAATNG
ncbi:MAG: hypothetical protein MUQ27_11180 [Acidimicrobiia bacterium]|nr:hypothetical protein [Acidimicrobiia bacterium]